MAESDIPTAPPLSGVLAASQSGRWDAESFRVEVADPFNEFRRRLDEWEPEDGRVELNRDNLIRLLALMMETFRPPLRWHVEGDDYNATVDHWATGLLGGLLDGLRDVRQGIPPPEFFRAEPPGSNSALSRQDRRRDDGIIEFVRALEVGGMSRREAEQSVADMLDDAKRTRRGRRYTADVLRDLAKNSHKRDKEKRGLEPWPGEPG